MVMTDANPALLRAAAPWTWTTSYLLLLSRTLANSADRSLSSQLVAVAGLGRPLPSHIKRKPMCRASSGARQEARTLCPVTTGDLLLRALNDLGDPPLRPLPDQVAQLLPDLYAPPR